MHLTNRFQSTYWLILVTAVLVGACVHELPLPKDTSPGGGGNNGGGGGTQLQTCSQDTVYFNNTILPIVNSTCGKSGCHGTVNRNAFSITSYSQIVQYLGTNNRLNNSLQDMAEKKQENPSLNYTPPTADQLALLQKWISQGSRNNTCNACDTTKFTFAANIKPILDTYCVGCHKGTSASVGVDLSSYSTIQSELTNYPGRLLGSIQWTSPYTGAKQMPQGGAKLSACYTTQIKKWIDAGALNN